MNKKICIVTTTINPPVFLEEYYENFQTFNVDTSKITFIIVGDNKTPKVYEQKNYLRDKYGSLVEYWSPQDQDKWLNKSFPDKIKKIKEYLVPKNDMRRRNVGYLRAHELQADIIITIDDDNLPLLGESWLEGHIRGLTKNHQKISSENDIVNPCRFLNLNHKNIYSRGYPISKYYSDYFNPYKKPFRSLELNSQNSSILNMGLWTDKPDVDAFTNLLLPNLDSEGLKYNISYSLSPNNYFPVNTQNTSFKKELGIFHQLFMDPTLFHRYDDVWMGLFCQRLMHKMGDTASFGHPIVEHKRNTHNYTKDFRTEFRGICLNPKMWSSIMKLNIESRTYKDGFLEIAQFLPTIFLDNTIKKYFTKMKTSMELWIELIEL